MRGWPRHIPAAAASSSDLREEEMGPGFRLTMGIDPGEVARASAAFAEFADGHALPAPVRRSIHVALDEFLHNTIVHGFAGRTEGEMTVEVALGGDRVTVTLTDNGTPFDPLAAAAPNTGLSVAERQIGGLGIHLVRRMMDEVSYHRRDERNVVVLVRLLAEGIKVGQRGGNHMDVSTRTEHDVTIIAFAGNLDSNTSPVAQQALDGILAGGGKKMIIDFSALDYISSAGLRVLLGTAKQLQKSGGALRLFGLNETVREVFEISGFSTILTVKSSEADARAGL
ncbi:MAG: anti-sigma factor antagonist [Gemmatimonadales bacterium]